MCFLLKWMRTANNTTQIVVVEIDNNCSFLAMKFHHSTTTISCHYQRTVTFKRMLSPFNNDNNTFTQGILDNFMRMPQFFLFVVQFLVVSCFLVDKATNSCQFCKFALFSTTHFSFIFVVFLSTLLQQMQLFHKTL